MCSSADDTVKKAFGRATTDDADFLTPHFSVVGSKALEGSFSFFIQRDSAELTG